MKFFSTLLLAITLGLTGCARTVMDTPENDALAKQFLLPSKDESGIYIYRDSIFGAALKKNLYIDGKLIGESAPKTYFYKRVIPVIIGSQQNQSLVIITLILRQMAEKIILFANILNLVHLLAEPILNKSMKIKGRRLS